LLGKAREADGDEVRCKRQCENAQRIWEEERREREDGRMGGWEDARD
jgi:hypothetical protein